MTSSKQFDKFFLLKDKNPELDLDHVRYLSGKGVYCYIVSSYNTSLEMDDRFTKAGWSAINQMYNENANSWMFITTNILRDLKPLGNKTDTYGVL
jgi:hypothetical protein